MSAVGPIRENETYTLRGGERVYHVPSGQWGRVERVGSLRWPLVAHNTDSDRSRLYPPEELLYIPNGMGPAYPCRVERDDEHEAKR